MYTSRAFFHPKTILERKTPAGSFARKRQNSDAVRRNRRPYLTTLDLNKMDSENFISLRNAKQRHVRFAAGTRAGLGSSCFAYFSKDPFPAHASGFLYYHAPPSLDPTAAAIRLRLAASKNENPRAPPCTDLLALSGLPWSLPIIILASLKTYAPFVAQLLADELVSTELLERCRSLAPHLGNIRPVHTATVHCIGQPFPMRFYTWSTRVVIVNSARGEARPVCLKQLFINHAAEDPAMRSPLSGACMLMRRAGELAHGTTSDLVLRIVKLVEPLHMRRPDMSMVAIPVVEGETLVPHMRFTEKPSGDFANHTPWRRTLDYGRKNADLHGLQLLFDPESGRPRVGGELAEFL
ncbi:hypothetical protein B0H11DRAFT_2183689 [Mycena galericulata]|nr:hypothetical protein B0H11DRAFT_2183689 [Mycena galericulata]